MIPLTAPHDAHSCSLSASSFLLLPPFLYKCPSGGQVGRQKRKVQKGQRGNSNGVLRRSTHPMPKMASGEAQQNAGTPEDRNAGHHGGVQRHRHVDEDGELHNGCQQLVDVDKPVGVFRRQVCRRAGPCPHTQTTDLEVWRARGSTSTITWTRLRVVGSALLCCSRCVISRWAALLFLPFLFPLSGEPDLCRCGETVREKDSPGRAEEVAVAAG